MKLAPLVVLLLLVSGCASQPPAVDTGIDPLLAESLEASWTEFSARYPDVSRPDVEVVRIMDAQARPAQLVDCLHEEGFPEAALDPDGGIAYEGSQLPAYDLAMYVCGARYPIDPKYLQPLTDEQLGALYDYYANELVPCIEAEGYSAPEAPTRQYFIEHYDEGAWLVYSDVSDATSSEAEWYRMNDVCPQITYSLWD